MYFLKIRNGIAEYPKNGTDRNNAQWINYNISTLPMQKRTKKPVFKYEIILLNEFTPRISDKIEIKDFQNFVSMK